MKLSLTQRDASGTTYLRPGALPLVVAAICVPVIGAMVVGVVTIGGTALGLAVGALAVATLIVIAVRAKPGEALEVAQRRDSERRVLVVALAEIGPEAAGRIAARTPDADDVRVLVPLRSRRLDRWLSAEDRAREAAQDILARSAGTLTAGGLAVSGAVGDQLRSFSADEVVVVSGDEDEDEVGRLRNDLALPLTRVPAA